MRFISWRDDVCVVSNILSAVTLLLDDSDLTKTVSERQKRSSHNSESTTTSTGYAHTSPRLLDMQEDSRVILSTHVQHPARCVVL